MEKQGKSSSSTNEDNWIDENIASWLNALGTMDLGTLEPFDWFEFHPLFVKKWLEKVEELIDKTKEQNISFKKLAQQLYSANVTRDNIYFNMGDVKSAKLPKEKRLKIVGFFNELAKESYAKDPYGLNETSIVHSKEELEARLNQIPFNDGNPDTARLLGRIYSGAYHFVNGLYLDFYTDYGVEYYGPYDVSDKFGPGTILVIKHFPDLKPLEIWPEVNASPCKDLKIFTVYENVSFKTTAVSCHGIFKGNTAEGMKKWALEVDGRFVSDAKEMEELEKQLSDLSVEQWKRLKGQEFEEMKVSGVKIRCFTLKRLFEAVGMDWKPTEKMLQAVKGKKLATKEFWGLPEDKQKVRKYWEKILDPRLDFYPQGAKSN